MPERAHVANAQKLRVRSVEHVFARQKGPMGLFVRSNRHRKGAGENRPRQSGLQHPRLRLTPSKVGGVEADPAERFGEAGRVTKLEIAKFVTWHSSCLVTTRCLHHVRNCSGPSFGQRAPYSAHGCKCFALLLFVPVPADAAASPGALASLRRPRSARSETDGGNNARADNNGTVTSDTKGTLRTRGAYHHRTAPLSRGIARPRDRPNSQSRSPTCATSAGLWRAATCSRYGLGKAPAGLYRQEPGRLTAMPKPRQCLISQCQLARQSGRTGPRDICGTSSLDGRVTNHGQGCNSAFQRRSEAEPDIR